MRRGARVGLCMVATLLFLHFPCVGRSEDSLKFTGIPREDDLGSFRKNQSRLHANASIPLQQVGDALALDAEGNLYTTLKGIFGFGVAKYRRNGLLCWVRQYERFLKSSGIATAVAVDGKGYVYVTGQSEGKKGDLDYLTVKYDRDGNEEWAAVFNGSGGDDVAGAIAVDGAGNVYVTGASTGRRGDLDFVTVKYGSSGRRLWVRRYDGPSHELDWADQIALNPDGGVSVTGLSMGYDGLEEYATVRYDRNGKCLRVERFAPESDSNDASS